MINQFSQNFKLTKVYCQTS